MSRRYLLVAAFAVIGTVVGWRAYATRNNFFGYSPPEGYVYDSPVYPERREDEILFPGVAGELLPTFDVSDPNSPPLQLEFPAMSCSGPFVFRGEVRSSHPEFNRAVLHMYTMRQDRRGERGPVEWKQVGHEMEGTTAEDGRVVFRIEDDPPPEPGRYRIDFIVRHLRFDVEDLQSLPLDDRIVTVKAAECMVEFVD